MRQEEVQSITKKSKNSINEKKYIANGGNEQRFLIKDARIGWRTLRNSQPSTYPMGFLNMRILNPVNGDDDDGQERCITCTDVYSRKERRIRCENGSWINFILNDFFFVWPYVERNQPKKSPWLKRASLEM